jgi:putative ABC transport system permease protein
MIMRLIRRARYWLHSRRHAAELAEEMAFHRSKSGAGAFGNATLAREDARAVWTWRWADDAMQDVRYTVRSMRRQPGFAAAAIAIVALGSGGATCAFGLLDALVMKSLPVERADRLVWLRDPAFSYPIFAQVRDRLTVFDGVFGWNVDRAYVDWTGSQGELAAADVLEASSDFFTTLRVTAVAGRAFDRHDREDAAIAVISHAAWTRHYAANPGAIGRSVRVGDVSYTIVGVTPPGFFGVAPGLGPELFVPVASGRPAERMASTTTSWLHIMARVKDGVSLAQADAALQAVWPSIMESTTHEGMPADRRARYLARKTALEPGRAGFSRVRNAFAEPVSLLMGLATLLLAVACASVANLLLARGTARRREIAVRLAIGANRARVFRQLLTEALVLTACGSAIGLLAASWVGGALVAFMTTSSEQLALDTSIGWRTAGFSTAVAMALSTLAALLPARIATRGDLMGGLKLAGQPGGGLLRRWSAGKALVVVQVALALVLLAGGALFGRSLARLLGQDTGLDVDRLLVVLADAAAAGHRESAQLGFYVDAADRLRARPGVESVALSWMPPISLDNGNWTQSITIDGSALTPTEARYVYFNAVSADYFRTVGTAVRRGRGITDRDVTSSPRIVVINESLARRFFANADPLGHRISIGKGTSRQDLEIAGVVQDAKYREMREATRSIAYLPLLQTREVLAGQNLAISIRSSEPRRVAADVRDTIRALDRQVPLSIQTAGDRVRESTVNERMMTGLAAALGLTALALACAGLYGLLAYAVSRHTREIGLRIALGARPASVLWLVQRESLVLALAGVAAGLGGALALGRFVRGLLFQVTPSDPAALAAAAAALVLVASAAAYVPARRAASVDPVVALKRDS